MRCSKCGTDNPHGMKFCGNCAAPLRNLCSRCGFDNPPGFKFCGECAATLAPAAPAPIVAPPAPESGVAPIHIASAATAPDANTDGERKTVTALFADIKGSMELMQDLDPEEARAIVDPALRLMMDAVHRYDGYIVQSTGDGIFALFGAPVAHEDHPLRALYAALRMQDEMRRYAERMRAEKGINLQVRVGVNTGEVVVRSIQTGEGHAEYTPIGHSTGLAARLQQRGDSRGDEPSEVASRRRPCPAGLLPLRMPALFSVLELLRFGRESGCPAIDRLEEQQQLLLLGCV
ncbi:MAG TPA: adenylate/guanylate cyclase domain-containing protein [Candidatus Binataceae bacterium]|nr:adenylate/guanylate cyclase domain-containing protein [Candidatus Binataceae bacterium]